VNHSNHSAIYQLRLFKKSAVCPSDVVNALFHCISSVSSSACDFLAGLLPSTQPSSVPVTAVLSAFSSSKISVSVDPVSHAR